jgi:hypothetical protein
MGPTVDAVTRIILAAIAGVPGVTAAAARIPFDLAVAMWGSAINAVAWVILAARASVAASTVATARALFDDALSMGPTCDAVTRVILAGGPAVAGITAAATVVIILYIAFAVPMSTVAVFRAGIHNTNLQRGNLQHHGNDAHVP